MTDGPVLTEGATEPTLVVRAGTLVPAWRVASIVGWVLVVFAYAAVWKTSVELGLATWWLGPRSDPQLVVIRILPIAMAIGFAVVSSLDVRRVPLINVIGALLFAAIAIPDLSRSVGIATIELVIAGAMLLVALASFVGVAKTVDG